MIGVDRLSEIARDVVLGKSRDEATDNPEEAAVYDDIARQTAVLPEGAVVDVPSEHPPEGYLSNLWGDPVSDEQIAASAGGAAPPAAPPADAPPATPADAPAPQAKPADAPADAPADPTTED